jgi:L-2-hydroxyglutarate oxidase LhgO
MVKRTNFDVLVIGGGFYGCALSLFLRENTRMFSY